VSLATEVVMDWHTTTPDVGCVCFNGMQESRGSLEKEGEGTQLNRGRKLDLHCDSLVMELERDTIHRRKSRRRHHIETDREIERESLEAGKAERGYHTVM